MERQAGPQPMERYRPLAVPLYLLCGVGGMVCRFQGIALPCAACRHELRWLQNAGKRCPSAKADAVGAAVPARLSLLDGDGLNCRLGSGVPS